VHRLNQQRAINKLVLASQLAMSEVNDDCFAPSQRVGLRGKSSRFVKFSDFSDWWK
jgi:hypothetical protein